MVSSKKSAAPLVVVRRPPAMSLVIDYNPRLSMGVNVLGGLRGGVLMATSNKLPVHAVFYGHEFKIQPFWTVPQAIESCAQMFNKGLDPRKLDGVALKLAKGNCPDCGSSQRITFFIEGMGGDRRPQREFFVACKGCGGEICADSRVERGDLLPSGNSVSSGSSISQPAALAAG